MLRAAISLVLVLALSAFSTDAFARGGGSKGSYGGSHSVKGYTRKDGTYVRPHQRTNPNKSKQDNWSTKGNSNPYSGKAGTVDPYSVKVR